MRWEPPPAGNAEGEAVLHVFPRVEVAGGQGQALPLEQPAGAGLALDRFLHAGDALHLGGVAGIVRGRRGCLLVRCPAWLGRCHQGQSQRRAGHSLVSHHLIAPFIVVMAPVLPTRFAPVSPAPGRGGRIRRGERSWRNARSAVLEHGQEKQRNEVRVVPFFCTRSFDRGGVGIRAGWLRHEAFREKGLILKSCTDLFIGWYTVEWAIGVIGTCSRGCAGPACTQLAALVLVGDPWQQP